MSSPPPRRRSSSSAPVTALYDEYLKKQPRQSRSRSVVEAILRAASEKISGGGGGDQDHAEEDALGEESVAVHDVAQRAGVGIGSLYDYFRDRKSLLAAFAAKITEDNLRAFEDMLVTTEALPLDEAIGKLVDFTLTTYTKNKRTPRAVLRIAHSIGLMPTLARSQTVFAKVLAESLERRSDIRVPREDVRVVAWMLTQAIMGVVHTLIWHPDEDHDVPNHQALRDHLVTLTRSYLLSGPSGPPSSS